MILDFREPFKIDQTFNTQKIDILFSLKVPPFSFFADSGEI